jgi:hypothetical protein
MEEDVESYDIRYFSKRKFEDEDESSFFAQDEESDSNNEESEDENHIEIDYPDEEDDDQEEHGEMNDIVEDSGIELKTNDETDYFSNLSNIFKELNKSVKCCVCDETFVVFPYSMDRLDQSISKSPTEKSNLLNPCGIHHTCVKCIKLALIQNTVGILKDGHGNFPCLGNTECTMHGRHRTTTFLYQLRELFTDAEWGPISQIAKSLHTVDDYHSYLVPLTPTPKLTFESCIKHVEYILNQDGIPRVRCPVCLVMIEKTTACFAIRHCDWEICWMCGKIERRLDQSHWIKDSMDGTVDCKCPRYDSHAFWKKHDYLCIEGKCYDDDRACDRNSHEKGRETMNKLRKQHQLSSFMKSLPDELKNKVHDWTSEHYNKNTR